MTLLFTVDSFPAVAPRKAAREQLPARRSRIEHGWPRRDVVVVLQAAVEEVDLEEGARCGGRARDRHARGQRLAAVARDD